MKEAKFICLLLYSKADDELLMHSITGNKMWALHYSPESYSECVLLRRLHPTKKLELAPSAWENNLQYA
jgi:hypothetical protein